MTDSLSRKKRSELMARIRSTDDASTETLAVAAFRAAGVTGWRRHVAVSLRSCLRHGVREVDGHAIQRVLSVRPDFVFRRERVAVFIDGCFWHGCPLHSHTPKSNKAYWRKKLGRNRARDKVVDKLLKARGWLVVRVWEHDMHSSDRTVQKVVKALTERARVSNTR